MSSGWLLSKEIGKDQHSLLFEVAEGVSLASAYAFARQDSDGFGLAEAADDGKANGGGVGIGGRSLSAGGWGGFAGATTVLISGLSSVLLLAGDPSTQGWVD